MICSLLSPTASPTNTNTVFQIKVPRVVKVKNSQNFIFDIPAGIEMRLRTKGINRPKNTVHIPKRSNQASALCISDFFTRNQLPYLSMIFSNRSTSSNKPTPYKATAPTTDPAVEAMITPGIVIVVVVVINPPTVKITSDGIGGKTFSSIISRKIDRKSVV